MILRCRRPRFALARPQGALRPWIVVAVAASLVVGLAACTQLTSAPWSGALARNGEVAASRGGSGATARPVQADGAPLAGAAVAPAPTGAAGEATAAGGTGPAAPVAASPRGGVAVKRGSIADELILNGRIVGIDEQPLSFAQGGLVSAIPVDAGQSVNAGQLLVELDSRQIVKDRDAARAKLETAAIRLRQAQAKADAQSLYRQQATELKRRDTEAQRQSTIAEAERLYNRVAADLQLVQAGATPVERSAAEATVLAARANLERAKIEQAKLAQGADPEAVRGAEAQLATAQAALASAQADLNRLQRGSPTDDVRVAERNVERAQVALQAAQAVASDPNNTASKATRDAGVAAAQVNLRDAQERLAMLRATPQAGDIDALRRKVDAANAAVQVAQLRLETVRKGPDAQTIAAASAAVASADAMLKAAQDKVTELNSRPTEAEVQDARAKVAIAAQALENARAPLLLPVDDDPTATYDVLAAQKEVEQAQRQLDGLERDLAATKLVAPFSGVVAAVRVATGTGVEAGRTAVVLARAGRPIVEASVFDVDAPRMERGQRAWVQVDGGDGTRLGATVVDLVRSASGVGTTARLAVDWQNTFPALGATTRVRAVLLEHADALMVPRLAVRSASNHQYVEVLDNGLRRTTEVELGIQTADTVEILSGLNEGDLIAIAPQ